MLISDEFIVCIETTSIDKIFVRKSFKIVLQLSIRQWNFAWKPYILSFSAKPLRQLNRTLRGNKTGSTNSEWRFITILSFLRQKNFCSKEKYGVGWFWLIFYIFNRPRGAVQKKITFLADMSVKAFFSSWIQIIFFSFKFQVFFPPPQKLTFS